MGSSSSNLTQRLVENLSTIKHLPQHKMTIIVCHMLPFHFRHLALNFWR